MSHRASFFAALVPVLVAAAACGGPEVKHPYKADEGTPANSTSEKRLAGEDPNQPTTKPTSATPAEPDPTKPEVNKVSDMPKAGSTAADDKPASKEKGNASTSGGRSAKPSKTGPKVSRAECDRAFEKAMELEIKDRPELQGVDTKQLMAMAKQMAKDKHGDAPCDATRSQYTCAMGATTTAEWKRCMQ